MSLSLLRLERNQKNSSNPFRIRILLFLSYSFAIETMNTFIHSRNSLKNYIRFQTKMGKEYTRFQTKMGKEYTRFQTKMGKVYTRFQTKMGKVYTRFQTKMGKVYTRFQTKRSKVYTRFQTKTAQKPYPVGRHIPI